MLSYQHGYHAGNTADVLKHFTLFLILESLKKKETPFHFYDTHAGAGAYNLASDQSIKTGEANIGIRLLLEFARENPEKLPNEICNWLNILKLIQDTTNDSQLYPGSPYWAQQLMRAQDKATLLELHPTEYQKLRTWKGRDQRIKTFFEDSFKNLKSHLPPKESRAVILIDPPYEMRSDYLDVGNLLSDSLKRFAHGIYLIWYPIVERGNEITMMRRIKDLNIPKTLLVEMNFRTERTGMGIAGTGMVIINCPWQIDQKIYTVLPWLMDALKIADSGKYKLEWLVPERVQ